MKQLIERYLAFLARSINTRFNPFVIGVTGSSGKTTIKEMIGELTGKGADEVRVSPGNMNTEMGLPLAVLGFKKSPETTLGWIWTAKVAFFKYLFAFKYPKYLVLEYAADFPGDIKKLCRIIRPNVAVISNIGVAHIEFFKSIENIAEEKWVMALSAKDRIVTALEVLKYTKDFKQPKAEIVTPGKRETAIAEDVKYLTNGSEFDFYLANHHKKVSFKLLGLHNIENLQLAALAALSINPDADDIINRVGSLAPQSGRGRRIIANDMLIIDESYNANPISFVAALKSFNQVKYTRKIAILGEMKEIGPIAKKSHLEIARLAKESADLVIGVGAGFKDLSLDKWYDNVSDLLSEISTIVKSGDAILIKGSHANNLEKIVEFLSK